MLSVMMVILLFSCTGNPEVTTKELQNHIKYLSSDSLRGRLTGSSGDSMAAEYIKNELTAYGLVPLAVDGFQRFKVISRLVAGTGNALSFDGKSFTPEKDFMPFAFSSNSGLYIQDGSVETWGDNKC